MIMLFQEKRIGISNTSPVFTRYQINTKTPSIARPLLFTRKFQKRKETTAAHLLIGCSPETWAWIRCSSGRRRRDSSWKTKFSSSWPGTCQHTPSAATSPARPQSCSGERGRHWDGWRRRSGGKGVEHQNSEYLKARMLVWEKYSVIQLDISAALLLFFSSFVISCSCDQWDYWMLTLLKTIANVIFNMFIFHCTENALNSDHKAKPLPHEYIIHFYI